MTNLNFSTLRVGFIGLGKMGHGMAANLVRAGLHVTVHDTNKQAAALLLEEGATWSDSAAQLASGCDILFTSLPTPDIIRSLAYSAPGLVDSLPAGAAWFDLSTNSLELVRELGAALTLRNVYFFDAPVSGGPAGAASGKLTIWAGGDAAAFELYRPILERISDSIRRIGDTGSGTTAKLLHNTLSASIHAVAAEILTVGVKAGIKPDMLYEALRSGAAGRRRSLDALMPRFLAGKFEPASFQLQLAHKDLTLGHQLSQELGVPTRICDLVYEEMNEAMDRGWGARDSQSFLLLQQERAGIDPIAVSAERIEEIRNNT